MQFSLRSLLSLRLLHLLPARGGEVICHILQSWQLSVGIVDVGQMLSITTPQAAGLRNPAVPVPSDATLVVIFTRFKLSVQSPLLNPRRRQRHHPVSSREFAWECAQASAGAGCLSLCPFPSQSPLVSAVQLRKHQSRIPLGADGLTGRHAYRPQDVMPVRQHRCHSYQ